MSPHNGCLPQYLSPGPGSIVVFAITPGLGSVGAVAGLVRTRLKAAARVSMCKTLPLMFSPSSAMLHSLFVPLRRSLSTLVDWNQHKVIFSGI